jgi:putative DNA primase/helicase
LIPFAVTIPPNERVADLAEKLRDEWPGILAWLIEGCLKWQTEGLRPPKAVLEATEAYLSAEDSLAAWIDEACARSPGAWEPSTVLFASWSNWANSAGEHPGSIKRFSQALESRGFTRIRQRRGAGNPAAGFDGLRLFQEPEPSWNDR